MFIRDLHCKSPREGVSISFDYLDFVWAPSCTVQRKPVYVCDECNFFLYILNNGDGEVTNESTFVRLV